MRIPGWRTGSDSKKQTHLGDMRRRRGATDRGGRLTKRNGSGSWESRSARRWRDLFEKSDPFGGDSGEKFSATGRGGRFAKRNGIGDSVRIWGRRTSGDSKKQTHLGRWLRCSSTDRLGGFTKRNGTGNWESPSEPLGRGAALVCRRNGPMCDSEGIGFPVRLYQGSTQ